MTLSLLEVFERASVGFGDPTASMLLRDWRWIACRATDFFFFFLFWPLQTCFLIFRVLGLDFVVPLGATVCVHCQIARIFSRWIFWIFRFLFEEFPGLGMYQDSESSRGRTIAIQLKTEILMCELMIEYAKDTFWSSAIWSRLYFWMWISLGFCLTYINGQEMWSTPYEHAEDIFCGELSKYALLALVSAVLGIGCHGKHTPPPGKLFALVKKKASINASPMPRTVRSGIWEVLKQIQAALSVSCHLRQHGR